MAQAVEVEVNTLTGEVAVLKVISVHDVGRAINLQQVEGQIEGCLAQAVGYALLEDFQIEGWARANPVFQHVPAAHSARHAARDHPDRP